MRSLHGRATWTPSSLWLVPVTALLASLAACGEPEGTGDPAGASSAIRGALDDESSPDPSTVTGIEATCAELTVDSLEVGQGEWLVESGGTLYSEGVYHCTVVGMVMQTANGHVYALAHFGDMPLEATLTEMAAALEAAGGRPDTLETIVGQGGADERNQMAKTLRAIERLDLHLVQVVANQYDDDGNDAEMEFSFDGEVFRYKRSLTCGDAFAS